MTDIRFLCEFFFRDFWHWLGGVVFLVIIVDGIFVNLFRLINNIVEYMCKKKGERYENNND
jgi:hypothetical protein